MGWKSSTTITRSEAIDMILKARNQESKFDHMSNDQLESLLYHYDYGDDPKKSYFGYNFCIVDTDKEKEEIEKDRLF